MRFHMRRAVSYIALSMVVFIVLVHLTADDFTDFNDDSYIIRGRREGQHDLERWQVKVKRPSESDLENQVKVKGPSEGDKGYISGRNTSKSSDLKAGRPKQAPVVIHSVGGSSESAHLWPDGSMRDRITAQIKYIPPHYDHFNSKAKVIYAPVGLGETPEGREKFIEEECPVDRCLLTTDTHQAETADAVLLQSGGLLEEDLKKTPGQVWILWLLESPLNTVDYGNIGDRINWTATYRRDSTIVTPYEKFVPFPNATAVMSQTPIKNYAKGKNKMAAWFVSNCASRNQRWELVEELQRYISVDIYGVCGKYSCQRQDQDLCNALLSREYKFYLSFENSNCVDYITEKFYWNALWNDIVPVVLGARKEDYTAVSPPNSFIHIEDFSSVENLAKYLLQLDRNDHLYNQYFQWKGSGEFINTKFWCRMCSMLHGVGHDGKVTWYSDVERWWRAEGVCTQQRWDNSEALITDWEKYYNGNA